MAANVAKLPDCQLELRQVPTRNNWNDASLFLVIQQCTILLTRDEARRIAANIARIAADYRGGFKVRCLKCFKVRCLKYHLVTVTESAQALAGPQWERK